MVKLAEKTPGLPLVLEDNHKTVGCVSKDTDKVVESTFILPFLDVIINDIRWEYRPCADAGQSGFISRREEIIRGLKEIEENRRGKCVLEEEAEDIHE